LPLVTPGGHGLGYQRDLSDHRDLLFDARKVAVSVGSTGGLTPDQLPSIWDQLQLGSCTAHGSLRAFVALLMRLGITLPTAPAGGAPFSRLEQYWNSRSLEGSTATDSGAQVRDAIKALSKFGVAAEILWPYVPSQFATKPQASVESASKTNVALTYHRIVVGSAGKPIRVALANKQVVVYGFNVPDYFEDGSWDPASGEPLPLPRPGTTYIGGHCVAATYFNFSSQLVSGPYYTGRRGNFFTSDNSWNTSWGMEGRFNIDAEWFNPARGLVSDVWVIDTAR
jgi:C1A family cysteine protease